MTLAEVHVEWSVILMDLLGPDIFSMLWMKGQVLHRERAHLKVPDWSLVWNELLTKKLPMFLSRLNEISGGCEKIVPVSESFWSNLMNDRFNCVVVRVKFYLFIYLMYNYTYRCITIGQPTLQETGPTVLHPMREDEAMWVKCLA